MDGLLGLIVALVAFAAFIYLASRSARPIIFVGGGLAALAVLLFFGVIRWPLL